MTTAYVVLAVCILIGALVCVIVDRTEERDWLLAENMHLHLKLTEAQLLAGQNPRALSPIFDALAIDRFRTQLDELAETDEGDVR